MALWIVFPAVACATSGVVVWFFAAGIAGRAHAPSASEVTEWRRLVWPLFAGALVLAFLAGWALQEPDPADERVALGMCLTAALVGAIDIRALLRALRSLCICRGTGAPIATIGLFRCRTVVCDAFRRAASPGVLAAALAHEAAHARARDPLRLWLAQIAADLQWPVPGARLRLRRWALALEAHRDDEAVASGVSPTALAEGILLAARLHVESSGRPSAAITGAGGGLAIRVRRLLEDGTRGQTLAAPGQAPWFGRACWAAVALAAVLGARFGDLLLVFLPGVGR